MEIPDISNLVSRLDRVTGARDETLRRARGCEEEISDLERTMEELDLVSSLFRSLIDDEITTAVQAVEGLQSDALRSIFADQTLKVETEVKVKRGKVDLSIWTVQTDEDGTETKGLARDSFGASVATVQSLLMRILVILKRGLRPVIIMDESLTAFDPQYASQIGVFLSTLCRKLGLDILMVTHNPTLFKAASRAYRVRRSPNGVRFELERRRYEDRRPGTSEDKASDLPAVLQEGS